MGRKTVRKTLLLLILAVTALLFSACSNAGNGEDMSSSPSASSSPVPSGCTGTNATAASCEAAGPGTTVAADRCPSTSPTALDGGVIEGAFGPWCENAIATAYDQILIPAGAATELTIRETDMDTTVQMQVQGFAADTTYRGTLHTGKCGANASDAGSEYVQDDNGGTGSSGLVLDFTTDTEGSAETSVTAPWVLPDNGSGTSILLQSSDGRTAGCVTLP